jgi:hypothetical protein
MWRKVLFLALAVILVVLVASSSVHAWGCYHASYHYGGYGGGYHAGYTHYSPYTGNVQHYSTGGGYGGSSGYRYGYHYGGSSYGGYSGYHYGYRY